MLLGLDIGTSALKAAVYDPEGRLVAEAESGYPTSRNGSAEEQDPSAWLAALERVVAEVLPFGRPAAAAVTGQMSGLLLAGADLEPADGFLPWSDRRAEQEARWLAGRLGSDRLYATTGCRPAAGYPAAKLRWVQQHRAAVWQRTRWVFGAREFITARLTGSVVTDPSSAGASQFCDIHRLTWWNDVLGELELNVGQLPPIRMPWELAGVVSGAGGRGLPAGIPVAVGAGDGACASLGAGSLAPGDVVVSIGTSGVVRILSDHPLIHARAATTCYPLAQGLYAGTGVVSAAGTALAWGARVLGLNDPAELEALALEAPPGARGLLFVPYLAGARTPHWDDGATGAFLGLTLAHDRACLARAVVEGVALSLAHALEALREAGAPPARLLLTGGGSRGSLLAATLTGLTGLPGFVARGGGATLGAAQLAAVAVGIHPDLAAARVAMAPPLEPIAPQALPEGLMDRYRKAAVGRGD